MLAVFQSRICQTYRVETCHVTVGKRGEPMAEGEKLTPTNSRAREERVFRDNSERERVCNCERRRMSERRKINEDRAKRDPSYVYFEELRIFLPFLAINFGSDFFIQFQYLTS